MAAKRTTKSDIELKREFAVERFFWTFCGQFVRARDAGLLDSPYSQILLCFKQNRHGFHTIRKEKPTAAAQISISFPIVAADLVCI